MKCKTIILRLPGKYEEHVFLIHLQSPCDPQQWVIEAAYYHENFGNTQGLLAFLVSLHNSNIFTAERV
mgnify:CR=1 FL=1